MIDYVFKSRILRDYADLLKRENESSKLEYSLYLYNNEGIVSYSLKKAQKSNVLRKYELINECFENGCLKELNECRKINDAYFHRTKRLKERINKMLLNGSCLFLTLTFTDDVLSSTSEETRRRYVQRFLKLYDCKYVANIDFGSDNHREHYHALINCDKVNNCDWLYGAINFERVRNRNIENDKTKLAKYIAKLCNHAIKETTKRNALIYSR